MNDKLVMEEFCKNHAIRVIDTNKRAYRYNKIDIKFFQDPLDYNKVNEEKLRYETEPLYTVEIAESELQKIASFESQVFANMRTKGHYGMFEMLMEQKEKEKYLRNNYPAVKRAYEHYSLILKMAESGNL